MSNEHCEILNRLFEDGYAIQIESGAFVTGNVNNIEFMRTADDENERWLYSDEHVTEAPLVDKFLSEVKVYARVDWFSILPEHMAWLSDLPSLQDWNQDLDNAYDEAGD